jgi:hypothetical protein
LRLTQFENPIDSWKRVTRQMWAALSLRYARTSLDLPGNGDTHGIDNKKYGEIDIIVG